jgi:hypothetical protein
VFNPNQPRDSHGRFGEIAAQALGALSQAAGAGSSSILAHVIGKNFKIFKPGPHLDSYHDDPYVPHLSMEMQKLHRDALAGRNTTAWYDKHATALADYTTIAYRALNATLRKAQGDLGNDPYKGWVSKLDSAISAGTMPHDVMLHRGVGGLVNNMLEPGKTVKDFAYQSATMNNSYADMFRRKPRNAGGATLHLLVNKGAKALPLHTMSSMPEEYEVLFPRGSEYKVLHREGHHVFAELL